MMCAFSDRLCEECALYRGRHYYLCFYEKYRGYLGEPGGSAKKNPHLVPGARSNGTFEIPLIAPKSAIDPFVVELENCQEEET
jgi:hypothetical protein